jgi:hypothetical protein
MLATTLRRTLLPTQLSYLPKKIPGYYINEMYPMTKQSQRTCLLQNQFLIDRKQNCSQLLGHLVNKIANIK